MPSKNDGKIEINDWFKYDIEISIYYISSLLDTEYDIDIKNLPDWIENSMKMDREMKEDLARLENQAEKTGVYR